MKALQTIMARVNRASLRERALLFLAAVSLLALFWNLALMAPLAVHRAALAQSLGEMMQRLNISGSSQDHDSPAERYAAVKAREASLSGAVAVVDAQLLAAQAGMIEPRQMVAVLTDVLGHQQGLTLVLLRNLPVEPLLPPLAVLPSDGPSPGSSSGSSAGSPAVAPFVSLPSAVTPAGGGKATAAPNHTAPPAEMGPYLHPVELVLRGDYLHVLAYLQELESRPWGFQWRRFEYTTTPDGPEFHIEFTTLSMQSNWLGV
jgi:MSHA biogenesis protein MshJ